MIAVCQTNACRAWHTDGITAGYGPPRILGDVLYNCATQEGQNAETAVGVSQERTSTTSMSEKVSLKLSAGLIGIAETSAEFEAFSKQATTFGTEVTTTNAVTVEPGWKGYTTTQVLSATVTGDAHIQGSDGVTDVTGIVVTIPGYQTSQDITDQRVLPNGITAPMTADDIATRCNAVNHNPLGLFGAAPRTVPTGTFELTLCHRTALTDSRCQRRKVTGPPPPAIGQATATLAARGRVYAAGTDTAGRIRLTLRRTIRPGKYTLTLRARVSRTAGYRTVVVPVTIR